MPSYVGKSRHPMKRLEVRNIRPRKYKIYEVNRGVKTLKFEVEAERKQQQVAS